MAEKISSELLKSIQGVGSGDYINVILELEAAQAHTATQDSRAERIAALKQSFGQTLDVVSDVVSSIGGEITQTAWLNRTARARIPADKINVLAEHPKILGIDVAHSLSPEVIK